MLYLLTICFSRCVFYCDIQENFKYEIMKIAWFNVLMLTPNFSANSCCCSCILALDTYSAVSLVKHICGRERGRMCAAHGVGREKCMCQRVIECKNNGSVVMDKSVFHECIRQWRRRGGTRLKNKQQNRKNKIDEEKYTVERNANETLFVMCLHKKTHINNKTRISVPWLIAVWLLCVQHTHTHTHNARKCVATLLLVFCNEYVRTMEYIARISQEREREIERQKSIDEETASVCRGRMR